MNWYLHHSIGLGLGKERRTRVCAICKAVLFTLKRNRLDRVVLQQGSDILTVARLWKVNGLQFHVRLPEVGQTLRTNLEVMGPS